MKQSITAAVLATLFVSAPAMAAKQYRTPCEDPSYQAVSWDRYLSRTMVIAMLAKTDSLGISRDKVVTDSGRAQEWAPMKKALLASKSAKQYKEAIDYVQGYGEFLHSNARAAGGEPMVYGADGTAFCAAYFKDVDSGKSFQVTYSVDLDGGVALADREGVMSYAAKAARLLD